VSQNANEAYIARHVFALTPIAYYARNSLGKVADQNIRVEHNALRIRTKPNYGVDCVLCLISSLLLILERPSLASPVASTTHYFSYGDSGVL
jgi:hypothetical protein